MDRNDPRFEGRVFVRFGSHRAREIFERRALGEGEQMIDLVSFHGPQIAAVPAAAWERLQDLGGNAIKGVTRYRRVPDLSRYMLPML